ncbi:hypothetical protein M0813_06508 [Anaeramoeba flamelloides]|uniref:Uncharacterized protein n=1 Tax=Anaeramoeba flamelloides TaxID=1746091 RepID=A0ABQ8XF61_9EUKA|nr:hypothetical protein M0813_06508 [Anaeramoeba flamelloides]
MTDIKKGGKYIRIIGFVVGICCLVFGLIDILREHVGTGIYSMILGVLVLINEMPIQPIADKLSFIFGDHRVRGIIYCL